MLSTMIELLSANSSQRLLPNRVAFYISYNKHALIKFRFINVCVHTPNLMRVMNLFFLFSLLFHQGYIVASPQNLNSTSFISSFGSPYPPGTTLTVVPGINVSV